MIVGIVGAEATKFDDTTRPVAVSIIRGCVLPDEVTKVVSGGCHLGGVDKWAEVAARLYGRELMVFKPVVLNWTNGYKPRNILIAKTSDILINITVKEYPDGYHGLRFKSCYHCNTSDHVKSGGCWTMKYARKLGKQAYHYIIHHDGAISVR